MHRGLQGHQRRADAGRIKRAHELEADVFVEGLELVAVAFQIAVDAQFVCTVEEGRDQASECARSAAFRVDGPCEEVDMVVRRSGACRMVCARMVCRPEEVGHGLKVLACSVQRLRFCFGQQCGQDVRESLLFERLVARRASEFACKVASCDRRQVIGRIDGVVGRMELQFRLEIRVHDGFLAGAVGAERIQRRKPGCEPEFFEEACSQNASPLGEQVRLVGGYFDDARQLHRRLSP